ncbi:MAG: RdgB/HAM1 family non-canonical purine NTP pyrophosphatase [Christensenellales bacterium]|jgi:XTP/dITP diphosphohydrolase
MKKTDRLLAASNNRGKIAEIKHILSDVFDDVVSLLDIAIELDTIEDGDTFEKNAVKKAEEAAEASGLPSLADDSGLCVEALGGRPGVFSSRYSGMGDAANNAKLLDELKHVYGEDRRAWFECCVALARPGLPTVTVSGVCNGVIAYKPAGGNGFGYDPLFLPDGFDKTFAELEESEKNAISHRKRALTALVELLREEGDA